MIKLILYGEPVAKGRARTVRSKGGFPVTYTPDKTATAEKDWKTAFVNSGQSPIPDGIPLRLELRAYIARPKSVPKKRIFPTARPDLDNILKLFMDSLTGIAYRTDALFVEIQASKRYVVYPDPPRVEIEITEVEL